MNTKKNELKYMTWKEVEEVYATNPVILIPLGSMEEHGPQSIVGDFIAADEVAKRVAEQSGSYCTPVVPFGYSEYFRDYPGTISVSPNTLYSFVSDMCTSLMEHGIKKILFVNGHAGNSIILEMLSRDLRREKGVMLGKIDIWQVMTPAMKQEFYGENQKAVGHGGEPVTSVMHYLRPDDMRMDLIGENDRQTKWQEFTMDNIGKTKICGIEACVYFNIKDLTEQGTLGDPYAGNCQFGEKIVNRMVECCVEFVEKMQKSTMQL